MRVALPDANGNLSLASKVLWCFLWYGCISRCMVKTLFAKIYLSIGVEQRNLVVCGHTVVCSYTDGIECASSSCEERYNMLLG